MHSTVLPGNCTDTVISNLDVPKTEEVSKIKNTDLNILVLACNTLFRAEPPYETTIEVLKCFVK